MWRSLARVFIAGLAALAARYAFHPPQDTPAASRLFAVAGFAFLVLALVAVLWEGSRRRRKSPSSEFAQSLLDPNNRRETFRIPYPEGERPALKLNGTHSGLPPGVILEVLNLSEGGACLRLPGGAELGGSVEGQIRLPGGQSIAVTGRVVCSAATEARLEFAEALPAGLLLDEQRRLRAHLRSAPSP